MAAVMNERQDQGPQEEQKTTDPELGLNAGAQQEEETCSPNTVRTTYSTTPFVQYEKNQEAGKGEAPWWRSVAYWRRRFTPLQLTAMGLGALIIATMVGTAIYFLCYVMMCMTSKVPDIRVTSCRVTHLGLEGGHISADVSMSLDVTSRSTRHGRVDGAAVNVYYPSPTNGTKINSVQLPGFDLPPLTRVPVASDLTLKEIQAYPKGLGMQLVKEVVAGSQSPMAFQGSAWGSVMVGGVRTPVQIRLDCMFISDWKTNKQTTTCKLAYKPWWSKITFP